MSNLYSRHFYTLHVRILSELYLSKKYLHVRKYILVILFQIKEF